MVKLQTTCVVYAVFNDNVVQNLALLNSAFSAFPLIIIFLVLFKFACKMCLIFSLTTPIVLDFNSITWQIIRGKKLRYKVVLCTKFY